jgi:hypothetical protein
MKQTQRFLKKKKKKGNTNTYRVISISQQNLSVKTIRSQESKNYTLRPKTIIKPTIFIKN